MDLDHPDTSLELDGAALRALVEAALASRRLLRCADCGARRQVIALITGPDPIQRILTHIGLAAQPPPIAPARTLPEFAALL